MQDKRTEVRMLCADMLAVTWKDDDGKPCKMMGLLEDISPRGACLQMECPLPIGLEVTFESPDQRFTGPVRYCVYREVGFFVGVEFGDGQWSKDAFEPQHFLDPQQLAKKMGKAKAVAEGASPTPQPERRAPSSSPEENRDSS